MTHQRPFAARQRSTALAPLLLAAVVGSMVLSPQLEHTGSTGDSPHWPFTLGVREARADGDSPSAHFERGVSFFKDGDYEAALVEFKRAYELAPEYRVLYNLGQTSRQLRDYASALIAFRGYLREGGDAIDAARKQRVSDWIAEIELKVASLTVRVNVPDAEIAIDDVAQGQSPASEPFVVNAGRRRVSATKAGYAPVRRSVDLAATDNKTVTLELVSLDRGARPEHHAPLPAAPPKSSPAPWVALIGTGVVAAGAGVFGGLAFAARHDLDEELAAFPGDPKGLDDAHSKVSNYALVTDILGGVAIAGAVTTVVLFITNGSSAASKPSSATQVDLNVGLGSVALTKHF